MKPLLFGLLLVAVALGVSGAASAHWHIGVDANMDGDCHDAGETVYNGHSPVPGGPAHLEVCQP